MPFFINLSTGNIGTINNKTNMAKPIFPDTTLCGQLFNDFLAEKPLLSIYSRKGKVVRLDKYMIVIQLHDTDDQIHISHRSGNLRCVEYETASTDVANEIITFLDTHFEKDPALYKSTLDVYDIYQGLVFVSVLKMAGKHYIGIRAI